MVLAGIGRYCSVTERTSEIGLRVAPGAFRRSILALIVRQGMALAELGICLGLTGAVVASSALVGLLFGISRLHPAIYFGVIMLLASVAAIACWEPARRAPRVLPSIALPAEYVSRTVPFAGPSSSRQSLPMSEEVYP